MNHTISPHYTLSHFESGKVDEIDIYEDRVVGWQLNHAKGLEHHPNKEIRQHAGFVILQICIAYVEGHMQYFNGEDSTGQSPQFFKDGIRKICLHLSDERVISDAWLDNLYGEVRCGLFHDGMTRRKVFLSGDYPSSIDFHTDASGVASVKAILINPHKLLQEIHDHFRGYIDDLRNPDEKYNGLRDNLKKMIRIRFS